MTHLPVRTFDVPLLIFDVILKKNNASNHVIASDVFVKLMFVCSITNK